MARKNEEITVRSGFMIDGQFVEIKDLTEKQRADWRKRQLDRIGRALGNYYNAHQEELAEFAELPGADVTPG